MSDPYRTAAIVPLPVPMPIERQGELMTKWTLNGVSLRWEHGDPNNIALEVGAAKATLDVEELRELAMMIARAIDEATS